ncbi:MAG TPA: DNA repair protein RecO [Candidatus Saccharimonadales bacterium]|nr:DNA repair protein RecO [Candidatus Saccharimonadales bacterium]
MASYSTRAIIIGRHNFGEADRIVVLLTPDRGVIRGVAKGVRKIKSRLAGHLELFSESDLMLSEGRNLDVITSARLVQHLAVGDNYDRMRLAYLVAEMVNRLSSEEEPHPGLYDLVRETYAELGAGVPDVTLELWFKLRLLDRLGYRPELKDCMICHTSASDRQYAFNVELGGIVDAGCSTPGNITLTQDQIKLWRLMLGHPLTAVRRVEQVASLATATLPICNLFYDYTFGKRFRSSEVLA